MLPRNPSITLPKSVNRFQTSRTGLFSTKRNLARSEKSEDMGKWPGLSKSDYNNVKCPFLKKVISEYSNKHQIILMPLFSQMKIDFAKATFPNEEKAKEWFIDTINAGIMLINQKAIIEPTNSTPRLK